MEVYGRIPSHIDARSIRQVLFFDDTSMIGDEVNHKRRFLYHVLVQIYCIEIFLFLSRDGANIALR